MPVFPIIRFPLLTRLAAVVLACGACQLAVAGVVTDRGRSGQLGRAAGNRLSASRSEAPGCELAVRDGSPPGEVLAPTPHDLRSSVHRHSLHPLAAFLPPLPTWSAGTLVVLSFGIAPPAPFTPAIPARGPPRG